MMFVDSIPESVSINEAVELAKSTLRRRMRHL